MTQASKFVVGGGGRGSTQARNRKYWPDGTFANSLYFLCVLIEAIRQDSRKICERKSRTKEKENVRGEP